MLMTILGFLLALLVLAGLVRWSDPTGCERMYRLVRQSLPMTLPRQVRRFLSSVLPWRYYPFMAPPGQAERTHRRRSRPFRR